VKDGMFPTLDLPRILDSGFTIEDSLDRLYGCASTALLPWVEQVARSSMQSNG
jgi:hypothetical protein